MGNKGLCSTVARYFETKISLQRILLAVLLAQSGYGDQLIPRNSSQIDSSYIGVQTLWVDLTPFRQDITRKMFEAGVKWCRLGVPWSFVERETIGNYEFASIDTIVNQLVSSDITPYLILSDANRLYNPDGYPPIPESTFYFNAWLAYVDTVVKRYRENVDHWEIWNEPNGNEVWLPEADPVQYSSLVIPTAQRIKSIDPSATVSLGGMALIDIRFLQSCLDCGVADYVDRIAFHPYRTIPEAPQSLLVWQPNSFFVSPYGSYDEEIKALRDTIALYNDTIEIWDTEGCFLSDSIYPDPLSPDPFNPQHASQTTQAKYLARRYILNLKHDIDLTTWTMTWDMTSLANNQGKSDWINDYTERTDFSFVEGPYMGLIFTPQNMYTHELEGEHFSQIYPPMEVMYDPLALNDTCVWTPTGAGDSGHVYYDFNLLQQGWYTYWSRSVGSNDSISIFLALLDTTYFMIGNWYSTSDYRWGAAMSGYIRFFHLDASAHESYVVTYWDGSRFDAWKLMKVDTICAIKTGYSVLQNVCSVFDANVKTASSFITGFTNINADSATFNTLTHASFTDTTTGSSFVPYWFAIVAQDNYTESLVRLTLNDTSFTQARLINFLTGEVYDIAYDIADTLAILDSLPAADFPYCVALDYTPAVAEHTAPLAAHPGLTFQPNPCAGHTVIKCTLGDAAGTGFSIKIYDAVGRMVKDLTQETTVSNCIDIAWDCVDGEGVRLPAGVYFCRIGTTEASLINKLILLK